ncbi:MAG: hypothetical protein GX639_21195 [Fibrobacter sp.]|nr:hypothetical protein [Fibrobacter sp.]
MNLSNVPLIPRKVLFDNPNRFKVEISPDGMHLAWLAPLDGVLNVWVAPRANPENAHPVTFDKGRGIRYYGWNYTNQHIFYFQDQNGDENRHIFVVALENILYPDEGHGFARPENNLSFNAIIEAFLAQHLGGRHEPIEDALDNSSLQIITGKGDIPGLEGVLAS